MEKHQGRKKRIKYRKWQIRKRQPIRREKEERAGTRKRPDPKDLER